MSRFRSSTLDYADEPQRWDRDKFERFSRKPPPRSPPSYEREDVEINIDRERFPPRGPPARVAERPPPRSRYEERDRFYEEERFAPPSRRRTDFLDEPTPAEIANRALAPYRRRPIVEREPSPPLRRPARPNFLRRQSSLDTFDRRAMPRYGDEYRVPVEVPIPLPIRRQRSPPRRYPEDDVEEARFKEGPGFEEYRDVRVRRERRRGGRSRSRAARSTRSASSSSSSFEEITVAPDTPKAPGPPKIGKKGKTRMPKRLAHKKAVAELGIPFEEDDDFLIIQRALAKENIDEIIEKSKAYREEKTIYKYEEGEEVIEERKEEHFEDKIEAPPTPPVSVAPPPPAPASVSSHHPGETIIKTTTTIIEGDPPPPPSGTIRGYSPARSAATSHRSHKSRHHDHETVEERRFSEEIGGPLMLVDRGRQSDHEIRREIKALEAERRALKLEREADERRYQAALIRDGDYEVIERVETVERPRTRSVVRVEKDRKGRRSKSKAPNPKAVAFAMATLV